MAQVIKHKSPKFSQTKQDSIEPSNYSTCISSVISFVVYHEAVIKRIYADLQLSKKANKEFFEVSLESIDFD